jgi:hypothetical protein
LEGEPNEVSVSLPGSNALALAAKGIFLKFYWKKGSLCWIPVMGKGFHQDIKGMPPAGRDAAAGGWSYRSESRRPAPVSR